MELLPGVNVPPEVAHRYFSGELPLPSDDLNAEKALEFRRETCHYLRETRTQKRLALDVADLINRQYPGLHVVEIIDALWWSVDDLIREHGLKGTCKGTESRT